MAKLGRGFTDSQIKVGKDMVDSFTRLKFAATAAKNQLGIIFAPILTQAADDLTHAIRDNFTAIKEWATYIGNQAKQVVLDFIAVLSGRDADVQNTWILKWRDNIKWFASEVETAVRGTIIPMFRAIGSAATFVADTINSVFGTQLTGTSVLAGAALLRIFGGFGLIVTAATLAASVVTSVLIPAIAGISSALVAVLFANPFILIVAGAFALGAAIVVLLTNVGGLRDKLVELVGSGISDAWQWLKDTFVEPAAFIGEGLLSLGVAITKLVATGISGAWQWLSDSFDSIVGYIQGKFHALVEYLRTLGSQVGAFFGFGGGASGQSGSPSSGGASGSYASGGAVVGPGSGTSDSILARLSNGEFVQRAAAVKHYGLAFMHAVNTLRFPVPQFSLGGLVDRINVPSPASLLPRFAAGGAVRLAPASGTGGMHPVVLDLGGGRKVGGLYAPPDAVGDLRKAALMQQISATGKRPSSVG